MKKLLILAYDFPPYVSVGGLRPYSWYKYLKEFGIEPIVVTRQWENKYGDARDYILPGKSKETIIEKTEYGTLIRVPFFPSYSNRLLLKHGESKYRFLRKILTAFDEFRQFITISGPKKQIYYAAEKYLEDNKVDAIIATGEPFVLFHYAKKLSQKFYTPWIADYRDLWSQHNARRSIPVLRKWYRSQELKIIPSATVITTPLTVFQYRLKELFPNKQLEQLRNGFDSDIFDSFGDINQNSDSLTFSYIGSIYDYHPWKEFLFHFLEFIDKYKIQMKLNLYGINKLEEVQEFLDSSSSISKKYIEIHPRMPNKDLLRKISKENVMLLFNDYSNPGTKIYDYLAVKRKIILCFSNDLSALELKNKYYTFDEIPEMNSQAQAEIIQETNSGIIVKNKNHLNEIFKKLINEFQENNKIACDSSQIESYSRKIQAKKLAGIVKLIN